MQYKNVNTPLSFWVKQLKNSPYFSAKIEDPATRSFEGQSWTSTKCDNRRDAKAVARQWADERLEAYRSPEAPKAAALHDELVKLETAMATSWSEDSHQIFADKSRQLVDHFGKDFDLHTLDRDKTEAYLNKRVLIDGVTPATVAKELGYMTRVAVDCGAIRKAPDVWPRGLAREFPGKDRALSTDEFIAIRAELAPVTHYERDQPFGEGYAGRRRQSIEHADPLGQDWRDHFTVYNLAGLRFSELYRLYPEHVTPEFLLVPGTKSRKAKRRVRLQADAREVLERRAREADDGPLFPITTKTAKTSWKEALKNQLRNWLRALDKACVRAGVPECTTNDLRRTFATWCRDSGVEESVCIGWMGHSSTKMIREVYAQPTLERQRLEAAKLPTFGAGVSTRTITPLAKLRNDTRGDELPN
jgi:integrase